MVSTAAAARRKEAGRRMRDNRHKLVSVGSYIQDGSELGTANKQQLVREAASRPGGTYVNEGTNIVSFGSDIQAGRLVW